MCGRTAFTFKWKQLHALLTGNTDGVVMPEEFVRAWQVPDPTPRFNFKPSERGPVLKRGQSGPIMPATMTWGFHANGASCARSESIGEVRLWRRAADSNRCIVPVSGFYEWSKWDGQAWYFKPAGGDGVLGIAGLWEPASGDAPDAYAVLTTAPNAVIRGVHDRMPLILPPSHWSAWMSDKPLDNVADLLRVPPDDLLTGYTVSRTKLARKGADDPSLVEPVHTERQGGLFAG
ncbi:MAG TPA: SOS response-associated peptidase [Phycisphaerales bacterium]|nr:SOS response-associated peptidase [Phycisphaerales bacterium]